MFQELLTVGERLRSNRQQVNDAASFRAQLWEAVKAADVEARRRGYSVEDIELAIFAVVAFLDESILNTRHPVFADWPRQPLQEERYGHHIAGEIFFQNLQKLLQRNDSHETADLLEVYYLCLLLGFAGRYSIGGRGDLRAILLQTGEKIQRIRQTTTQISPYGWLPQDPPVTGGSDPWVKTMMFTAIGCLVLIILLFVIYKVSLGSGASDLKSIAFLQPAIDAVRQGVSA
ncbi:MAG: type IVB secretion system protein IcmH/DotU [Bryobacteraceae bacterium]